MRPIELFLEDAKRKAGIKSDRELAKRLGINPSAICHFRTGDSTPSQAHCKKLADIAGEPFEKVLLLAQISKASELTKPAWERILKAAVKAGAFTMSLLLFSMASPTLAQASTPSLTSTVAETGYYVKLAGARKSMQLERELYNENRRPLPLSVSLSVPGSVFAFQSH